MRLKISEKIDLFSKWIIMVIFAVCIFFLTAVSIFGNCFVNNEEYTFFVSDYAYKHVAIFFIITIIMMIWKTIPKKVIDRKFFMLIWYGFLILYTVAMIIVTFYVSLPPRADQRYIVDAANKMLVGDFSPFENGGYLNVYPNQVGIVYLLYWLFKIFPIGYKIIWILNAISLSVIFGGMDKIAKLIFEEKKHNYLVGIATVLFIPLTCYVTFVYGNLIGQALSTLGIYFYLRFRKEPRISSMLFMIVTLALSVLVKENFVIPVIGVVIVLSLDLLRKPIKRKIVAIIGIIVVTILCSTLVKMHTEYISGHKISEGVPTLAWIVMGMQEGYMAEGWHNAYNEMVFRENGCDSKLAYEQVKSDLNERIKHFINNPGYTLKFFFKKQTSQWNNPTFEGFWINDVDKRVKEGQNVRSLTGVLRSVAGEPGNAPLKEFCNVYSSMVLFGVCLWIYIGKKEITINDLLLAIVFIGGFVFHTIWEAKCQYVMPYFVLLLPYSVRGYQLYYNIIVAREKKEGLTLREKIKNNKQIVSIIVCMIAIMLVSIVGNRLIDKCFGFGNERYEEYLASKK